MTIARYKDFLIETVEISPGRWRTMVRRRDGCSIETNTGVFESISSGGVESLSSADAIVVGKALVDRIHRKAK